MALKNGSRGRSAPQRERTIEFRFFLSVVLSLSLLAGPVILVSCGGGGDPEPEEVSSSKRKRSSSKKKSADRKKTTSSSRRKTSSGSSGSSRRRGSALEDEVASLLEQARDSGADTAFASAYRKAKQYYDDAIETDDEKRAAARLERAQSTLTRLLSDHKELLTKKSGLETVLKEAEEAKAKALEAGADKLAAIDYQDALDVLEEAKKTGADASSAREVQKAADTYKTATELFEESILIAKENESQAKLAQAEREAMESYRDQAKERGANIKAITDWAAAERNERRAMADLEGGRFQAAIQGFQQATSSYLRALQNTLSAEEMKKLAAENAARTQAYLEQQKELALKKIEAEKEAEEAKAKARQLALEQQKKRSSFTPLGSPGGPGSVQDLQSAFAAQALQSYASSFNASIYRQELDEDDEELLRNHYSKLAPSLQYDPNSGVAFVDYTSGAKLRQEFGDVVRSLQRKNYISFVNRMIEGSEDAQSFMANTRGTFLIPIPFKYRVRIEWDMTIQTMDSNGTFNTIVMYNTKNNHYLTNWIHWQSYTRGSAGPKTVRAVPGKYSGSANYWFDKTREIGMVVEFKMPGEELETDKPTPEQITDSAVMTAIYDAKVDPVENTFTSSRPITDGGFIGFKWHRVKFTVKRLKISGILDKELAVRRLREITGIKKKAPSKKEPPKKQTGTALDSLLKPAKGGDEPDFDF